jgi:hypothetical protein
MVHLAPLPGSPRYGGAIGPVVDAALRDAEALAAAGVDAMILENFGDAPFVRGAVAPETVASMAALGARVAGAVDLPLGVNVLRNDGRAALGVAVAIGARFIRVNVLAWARLTDQGMIESDAAELQRARAALHAGGASDESRVLVLADVAVKHSAPLAPVGAVEEARAAVSRALADAVVVTGAATGAAVDLGELRAVARAVAAPVLAGSGVTAETAAAIRREAAGAIVGSALMRDGLPGSPIDLARARRLVAAWRQG